MVDPAGTDTVPERDPVVTAGAGDGFGDALRVGVGVGVGDALRVGVGDAVRSGVGVGVAVRAGVGVAVGDAERTGVGEGVRVGAGVAVPVAAGAGVVAGVVATARAVAVGVGSTGVSAEAAGATRSDPARESPTTAVVKACSIERADLRMFPPGRPDGLQRRSGACDMNSEQESRWLSCSAL